MEIVFLFKDEYIRFVSFWREQFDFDTYGTPPLEKFFALEKRRKIRFGQLFYMA